MRNEQFEVDVAIVNQHFPKLDVYHLDGESVLAGELDIIGIDGELYDTFTIEIRGSEGYPYYFPSLHETSNLFPKVLDWHVYEFADKSCCVDIAPSIALKCIQGKHVLAYIKEEVIPYFANQSHRIKHGYYLYGEYDHGVSGLLQFYRARLNPKSFKQLIEMLFWIMEDKKLERQAPCPFCGGLKFRKCHKPILEDFSLIKNNVNSDGGILLKFYQDHKVEIDLMFSQH